MIGELGRARHVDLCVAFTKRRSNLIQASCNVLFKQSDTFLFIPRFQSKKRCSMFVLCHLAISTIHVDPSNKMNARINIA